MAGSIFRVFDNGEGVQVAVGQGGLLITSHDGGATWVTRNSGVYDDLYGAAFGVTVNDLEGFVVVGAGGTILTSPDAITWTQRVSFTTSDLYDVAFSSVFLAVGVGGAFGLSDDLGTTWDPKDAGTQEDLVSITADLGAYLIVGDNDTVITGNISALNFEILVQEGVEMQSNIASNAVMDSALTENMEIVSEEYWIHDALGAGTTITQGGANQFVYLDEYIYASEQNDPPTGSYTEVVVESMTILSSQAEEKLNPAYLDVQWPMFVVNGRIGAGSSVHADILWPMFKVEASIGKKASADILWPMFTVEGIIDVPADISGDILWPMFTVNGRIDSAALVSEVADLIVWILNQESQHHSTYSNWQPNSMIRFNGQDVAAMPGGVFTLEGDDDDGEVIESKIYWPPAEFAEAVQKRLEDVYVRMRGASSQMKLVLKYDETEIRNLPFDVAFRTDGNYVKRIKPPKGRSGNVIQIGLESVGDDGFDFFEVEVVTVPLKRRIR